MKMRKKLFWMIGIVVVVVAGWFLFVELTGDHFPYRYVKRFDDQGNLTSVTCVDRFWGTRATNFGVNRVLGTYSNQRLVLVQYLGLDGNYVDYSCFSHCTGYAKVEFEYDSAGNLVHELYFNKEGALALNEHSYAEAEYTYDANEMLEKAEFFNEMHEPAPKRHYKTIYSRENGNLMAKKYYFDKLDSIEAKDEEAEQWLDGEKYTAERVAKMELPGCY